MKLLDLPSVVFLGALTSLIISGGVCQATTVQLIQNGGFESGNLNGWGAPLPNPNPWEVVSNNPHTGFYSSLNPVRTTAIGETTLFQSVDTNVSQITSAGFWYYNGPSLAGVGTATYFTFSDGTSAQDTLFADDKSYRVLQWTYFDWMPVLSTFTDKHLVQVGFFPKASSFEKIDDVSIEVTTPEPGTWIAVSFGVFAIAAVNGFRSKFSATL